jgi:hypothetical protein
MDPYYVTFEVRPANQGNSVSGYDAVLIDLQVASEDNGRDIEKQDKVLLKSVELSLLSGESNFDNYQSFDFYLETITLPQKKIAWPNTVST